MAYRVGICSGHVRMRGKSVGPWTLLAAVMTVIASGCAGSATSDGTAAQLAARAQPGVSKRVVVCDPAFSYRDLTQLRRASSSVVVFQPTGARRVRKITGVPFTISKVAVRERVAGARTPRSFALRQTAAEGVQGCEALVSHNDVYLAYLAPFRFRPGGKAVRGEFVAVALFVHAGSVIPGSSAVSFLSLNTQQPALPARISIAQARRS